MSSTEQITILQSPHALFKIISGNLIISCDGYGQIQLEKFALDFQVPFINYIPQAYTMFV